MRPCAAAVPPEHSAVREQKTARRALFLRASVRAMTELSGKKQDSPQRQAVRRNMRPCAAAVPPTGDDSGAACRPQSAFFTGRKAPFAAECGGAFGKRRRLLPGRRNTAGSPRRDTELPHRGVPVSCRSSRAEHSRAAPVSPPKASLFAYAKPPPHTIALSPCRHRTDNRVSFAKGAAVRLPAAGSVPSGRPY